MGEYSVGVATRNKIYSVAKRLFYEQGVEATTYAQICDGAEVNRGLIPYYFKGKPNIAIAVFNDFLDGIEKAIDQQWHPGELIDHERNIIYELLEFRLFTHDKNALRFYSEILGDRRYQDATLGTQEEVMRQLAAGSGVEITPAEMRTITSMVNGTESELVKALERDYLQESVEDFVRRDMLCCFFLLGSDIEQASRWCDSAFQKAAGLTLACTVDFNTSVVRDS